MVLSIGERIKGFLFNPSETFDASKEDTLGDAFKYFIVLLLIYAVLYAIVIAVVLSSLIGGILDALPFGVPSLGAGISAVAAVVFFVYILIAGLAGVFIVGLWTHLWVYLLGGKNGLEQTIKAVMYGETPSLLLGWIPIVGIIFGIWTLIVGILGIRQLHEMSTGKAVLAVIIAIAIPIIIYVAIIAAFIASIPTGPGFGGF